MNSQLKRIKSIRNGEIHSVFIKSTVKIFKIYVTKPLN